MQSLLPSLLPPLLASLLPSLLASLLPTIALAAFATAQDPDAVRRIGDDKLYTLGKNCVALADTLAQIATKVEQSPNRYRNLELGAWQALALDAHGANLRYGHRKDAFRKLIAWLRMGMQPNQTPTTVDENTPRELHLLATFAVARAQRESDYKLLQRAVQGGWSDVRDKFTRDGAAPATSREAALLVMFAQTMQQWRWPRFEIEAIQIATDAVTAIPPGRDKLADAVRHQLERLTGTEHPADLTIAICWPGDVARDPFQAVFAAFVTRSLPPKVRERQWQSVEPWISVRAKDGLWDVPGDGDRNLLAARILAVIGMSHEPKGFVEFEPKQPKDDSEYAFR